MFANSYALTNPMPYAGFMVVRFGVADSKEDAGYYAGWVMTAFMLGRFASSFYCGWLSDRISRKFVIRAGIVSCGVFQILFGAAPNYSTALAARALMGLFNGMSAVAKATIPELVPADEQQTAMGWLSAVWGLGLIVGPAAGGLLAGRSGFLLPNLLGAFLALAAFVAVEIYLPGHNRRSEPSDHKGKKIPAEALPVIIVYSVYSVLTMAFDETLPLWLLAPVDKGGAELEAEAIGAIMAVAAVGSTALQFAIFPFVSKRINPTRLFRTGCLCTGCLVTMPAAIAAARWNVRAAAPRFWGVLVASLILLRFSNNCSYTSLFVCTNNSAPAAVRGAVNGLSMSVASAFKAGGPLVGTMTFAWSLHNNHVGASFLFVATASLCAALAAVALCLLPAATYDQPPDELDVAFTKLLPMTVVKQPAEGDDDANPAPASAEDTIPSPRVSSHNVNAQPKRLIK